MSKKELKKEIRAHLKKLRGSISNKKEKNHLIFSNFISLEEVKKGDTFFIYLSTKDEVETDLLIDWLFKNRKTVLVPIINQGFMCPVKIESLDNLKINNFGIREPKDFIPYIEKIDIIILPGLGFDKKKQRIGYGKGFYDRFLAREEIIKNSPLKIGLCFSELILEEISIEEHDMGVDIIITED